MPYNRLYERITKFYGCDMGIDIKNGRTQQLLRELAGLTGESFSDALTVAVEERLRRERARRGREGVADRLLAIGRRCAALPVRDDRTPDEILGYEEMFRRDG